MSLAKVWLSFIDYRPDPTEPERDRVVLGCVLQARRGEGQEYSLAARMALTDEELSLMDGIGRRMLARPAEGLSQEFRRMLEESADTTSHEEGGGLRVLSEAYYLSLCVSPPRVIHIERHLSQNNGQALHQAGRDLLIARMLGRDVPLSRPLPAERVIPADWKDQLPPAWRIRHGSLPHLSVQPSELRTG